MVAAAVSLPQRLLLLGLAVCALLHFASRGTRMHTAAFPAVAVATEGSFKPEGWYPGEPFADTREVRAWGSWSGGDENTGTLAIGPFPAPRRLRVGVGGYPNDAQNILRLERVDTAEQIPIKHGPVGERWQIAAADVPAAWVGRPVRLVAIDAATGLGGWLAVSEPLRGGRAEGNHALLETFAAWSINGLLLGLVFFAAVQWLIMPRSGSASASTVPHPEREAVPLRLPNTLPPEWIPLAAAAIVAACGYLAFWAFFANALFGVIFAWSVLSVSLLLVLRGSRRSAAAPTPELARVVKLMLAVGAFHLALLHLFPTWHDFYTLAANRYRDGLPTDNQLPHELGERMFASQPIRRPAEEWLSSDRPPLQTGWQLLTWPAGKTLDLDRRSLSGTSAVWFQLLWIAAAWGLLRTLRVEPRRAAGWIAALALTGFFVQNTVFTWPKLSAGAFTCGAFALLALPGAIGPVTGPRLKWAAFFAALAWLSHGGVAFSFIGLLPVLAWQLLRRRPTSVPAVGPDLRAGHVAEPLPAPSEQEVYPPPAAPQATRAVPLPIASSTHRVPWRGWLAAAAVFAVLILPWLAYQKFYEPPANRLFKWHLAGQSAIDPRGTLETLRESYATIGWREIAENKLKNFHAQFYGDWSELFDLRQETSAARRGHEFFHAGRALTWWPLLAAFALVLTRRSWRELTVDLAALAWWLLLTVGAWCLLMFGPFTTVVHQGSYALMIGLFVFFAVLLERCSRQWLALLVVLQAVTLGTTWAVGNVAINGPASGLIIVLITAAILACYIVRALRASEGGTSGPPVRGPAGRVSPPWLTRLTSSLHAWWQNPRPTLWFLLALAVVLFLRKPHALLTPQLWAEDGSVFLNEQDELGLRAFFTHYMGYLHTLPRIVAWLAAHLLDPRWWPAFYNGVAFTIWIAVLARFFTARFDLPHKPWLVLAFLLVPHTGEIFFNVTNLQWLTAFVLIQQALIAPPHTTRQRAGDLAILVVVGLTGPFVIAFLPLFAWRWWRARDAQATLFFAVIALCAAVQAAFVLRAGEVGGVALNLGPLRIWEGFTIVTRRLLLWPVLGRDVTDQMPVLAAGLIGLAFFGALLAWLLRPHARRLLRVQVLAAGTLILAAGLYRMQSEFWPADNIDVGDRYFYIPRVLLAWLLIWEFDAVPRFVAGVARVLAVAIALMHLDDYISPAPEDYQWTAHVSAIREGRPAAIPITPKNWTLHYRGRPQR